MRPSVSATYRGAPIDVQIDTFPKFNIKLLNGQAPIVQWARPLLFDVLCGQIYQFEQRHVIRVDKTFQNVPLLPVQKQVAAPIESVPIIGV